MQLTGDHCMLFFYILALEAFSSVIIMGHFNVLFIYLFKTHAAKGDCLLNAVKLQLLQ